MLSNPRFWGILSFSGFGTGMLIWFVNNHNKLRVHCNSKCQFKKRIDRQSNNNENDFSISVLIGKDKIGQIIGLNNNSRIEYDITNNVIVCDIDLDKLKNIYNDIKIVYKQIITYPSIKRDVAILVDSKVKHSEIVENIFKAASHLLKDVNLFDIYEDKSLKKNTKSMAYSLKFQSSDRTLTTKEVDEEMALIMKNLKTKLKAKQR